MNDKSITTFKDTTNGAAEDVLTLTVGYNKVTSGGIFNGERKNNVVAFDRLNSVEAAKDVLVDCRRFGWTITSAVLVGPTGKVAELVGERLVAL